MPARRFPSLLGAASVVALVLVLGACTPGGQFDPTEALSTDIFSTKKKLQGEREPLFPQGVPGTETGVPPDLVKGYQPPPEQAAVGEGNPAPQPVAAEKPKPKPKPRPKVAHTPPAASRAAQSPWPPAQSSPAQGQPAQTNWPSPSGQPAQTNWRRRRRRPTARTGGRPDKLAAAARPARTGGRRPDKLAGAAAADAVRRKTALASLA